ncbi:MAG: hypothetical protein WCJ30_02400 [Deltaproteobacteria bacterium]
MTVAAETRFASGVLAVGARFACARCRERGTAETCARCDGPTVDLSTPEGAALLARLCRSHHAPPARRDPFRDRGKGLLTAVVLGCAVAGAYVLAHWSTKHIDAHGFVPRKAVTALAALCGGIGGLVAASVTGLILQVLVAAAGALVWSAGSLALAGARAGTDGRARGWQRGMLTLRALGRDLAVTPFDGARRVAELEPLGPVLAPRAPACADDGAACEGVLEADERASIGGWEGVIMAVEGRTQGSDVCDAALVPFRVRTDDGDLLAVHVHVGCVRFVDPPAVFACCDGLPASWGVAPAHGTRGPVNVWTAAPGARVRVTGGRRTEDGALIGDAGSPVQIAVL